MVLMRNTEEALENVYVREGETDFSHLLLCCNYITLSAASFYRRKKNKLSHSVFLILLHRELKTGSSAYLWVQYCACPCLCSYSFKPEFEKLLDDVCDTFWSMNSITNFTVLV